MRFDAAAADRGAFEQVYDVCVIGGGPAGITVSRVLARQGAKVALMEAGGLEIELETQDPYVGENIGQDYFPLDTSRLRFFGGTSNHWAGWCRTLEPVDFTPKSYNPLSGWPITKLDLDPYREEADEILDVPNESEAPNLPFKQDAYRFFRFQFRWSPPTRFSEKYLEELTASEGIDLWLNANLVAMPMDAPGAEVQGAVFKSYAPDDPGFTVKAKFFVLATGGIENARLLLALDQQFPEGIGNRADMVGRFFCDHPHFVISDVVLRQPQQEREYFAPTEEFLFENEILNFGLRLEPEYHPPETGPVDALLRGAACGRDFSERLAEKVLGRELANCDLGGVTDWWSTRGAPRPEPAAITRIAFEQALNPDSRVRLGTDRDAFGLRRAALDWHMSERDIHTMRTAAMAYGAHIAEQDIGRLKMRDWLVAEPAVIPGTDKDEVGGKHHMGTTRMSADPRDGVVNADCRVHGIDNLYIGGSSVFSTPGHSNPTYTLTQLALRLGDHLTGRLAG
jgi:choline dehydrogenase-like flavoprotein